MKKILMTTNHFAELAGSEMTLLEHIEYFSNEGYFVEIFTNHYSEFMVSQVAEVTQNKFFITSDANHDFFINNYDIIWIQHQLIPNKILDQLSEVKSVKPKFIFIHMSSFVHLEFPWLYNIENRISDLSLVISDEVFNILQNYKISTNIQYYRNPTNKRWLHYSNEERKKSTINNLRSISSIEIKVLVVSNHIPEEVLSAVDILRQNNFVVDIIGRGFKEIRVTPEIISEYDIVFTIGKTVQYSILLDRVVYCYDHFGGPGFLNKNNFDKAKFHNFSGRGFGKKQADEIVNDFLNFVYDDSYHFDEEIKNEFIIDYKLGDLLKNLKQSKKTYIENKFTSFVRYIRKLLNIPYISKLDALKAKNLLEMYRSCYRTYEHYKNLYESLKQK